MAAPDTIKKCLAYLRPMKAGRDDAWNEAIHADYYGEVFSQLEDRLALKVAREAADTFGWRPSRSDLWELAAEIASPAPTVEDAFQEVCYIRGKHGRYARKVGTLPSGNILYDVGEPTEWSHPLVGLAVKDMGGWFSVVECDKDSVLQAQFVKVYNSRLTQFRQEVRKFLPLPAEMRPAGLFPRPEGWQPKRLPVQWQEKAKPLPPLGIPAAATVPPPPALMGKLRGLLPALTEAWKDEEEKQEEEAVTPLQRFLVGRKEGEKV